MGERYARILARDPECELVAVTDLDVSRAQLVASALGCEFCPPEQFVARADIEAICVCVPEDAHAEIAIPALDAGKDVLVEKPLAGSVIDARRIRDAAQKSGRIATVGHLLRFDPHYHAAFQRVRTGALGELLYAYAWRESARAAAARYVSRSTIPMHLMVHDIDLLRWFTGAEVTRVQAAAAPAGAQHGGMTTGAMTAILEFSNGMMATLVHSWALPSTTPSPLRAGLRMVGTSGEIEVDLTRPPVSFADTGGHVHGLTEYFFELETRQIVGCLRSQIEHFARCVRTRTAPLISLEDGVRAVEVADSVLRAAFGGRVTPVGRE